MPDDFNPGPLRARMEAARKDAKKGGEKGMRLAANHLLRVSRKLTPHEEGTLERSGKVSVDFTGSDLLAAVSFDTPYAVRQHEELDYKHDEGRQAKYLEQPMHTEANTMSALIGTSVRQELQT